MGKQEAPAEIAAISAVHLEKDIEYVKLGLSPSEKIVSAEVQLGIGGQASMGMRMTDLVFEIDGPNGKRQVRLGEMTRHTEVAGIFPVPSKILKKLMR